MLFLRLPGQLGGGVCSGSECSAKAAWSAGRGCLGGGGDGGREGGGADRGVGGSSAASSACPSRSCRWWTPTGSGSRASRACRSARPAARPPSARGRCCPPAPPCCWSQTRAWTSGALPFAHTHSSYTSCFGWSFNFELGFWSRYVLGRVPHAVSLTLSVPGRSQPLCVCAINGAPGTVMHCHHACSRSVYRRQAPQAGLFRAVLRASGGAYIAERHDCVSKALPVSVAIGSVHTGLCAVWPAAAAGFVASLAIYLLTGLLVMEGRGVGCFDEKQQSECLGHQRRGYGVA